jgi:hypothetical protein
VLGPPEPGTRLVDGVQHPVALAGYSAGRLLQDALAEAYVTAFGDAQR